MSKERSSEANNVEDSVPRRHSARASAPQNDPVHQSSSSRIQPSRTARKPRTSRGSGDDVEKEGLKPEPIRPRSPNPILPAATPNKAPENPETIPRSREPSASRRAREQSHDRSNSFPLLDDPDIPFIPPLPSPPPAPQMASQNYYNFATRPEQMPYTMYEPGIRSVPQPSRQMPYTTYDSGIRSVPQPSRQMPDNMYDPGPQSVPLHTRPMPSNVYDSGPQSVPLPPFQQTPHVLNPYASQQSGQRYARVRRGDAFVANDPFHPSKAKKGSDIPYDSFDNMPTDMSPPSLPYVIPSQQQPIILSPPQVIPSQPPAVPSQPPIIPPQPSVIYPGDPYPSQPPIVLPPPHVIPSQPPIIPSQPPIIYPSDPYSSQRPYPGWARPSASAPPMRPATPPGAPIIPYPAESVSSRPSSRSSTPPPPRIPVPVIPYPESVHSVPSRSRSGSDSPPPRPPVVPESPPLIPPSRIRPPRVPSAPIPPTASPPLIPDEGMPSIPTGPRPTLGKIDTSKPVFAGLPSRPLFSMPPPQDSPMSSPISPPIIPPRMPIHRPSTSSSYEGTTEDQMTPTGPLPPRLPRPRPPVTVHSPTLTFDEPSGDPSIPLPSEYPNGYGPYFEQHGIDINNEKFSFRSTLRKLFTWPFTRPKLKPSPHAYIRPPYSYPPYPPYTTPQTVYVNQSPTPSSTPSFTQVAGEFVTRTLPTQIYLHFLLRLPSLYFSRVARIFEEADLTLPEIKKMALETASKDMMSNDFYVFESTNVPPQYTRLKETWEGFIDSVMREWKTFNIISVLLLSAILTILQIQSAEQDPIIRYTALSSLICALISLLFGCMYIIRFGSMRRTYKAAEWALEAKRTRTTVWWNVWVLLAMPVVWLAWSIILYIACIMTFIWRTSSQDVAPPLVMSNTTLLVIRVVISAVLGLGIVYATLIMSTFRRYGETMDKAWRRRISGWIEQKSGVYGPSQQGPDPYIYLPPSMQPYPPGYPIIPGAGPPYAAAPTYVPPAPSPSPPLAPDGTRWRDYGYPPDRKTQYPDSDYGVPYGYAAPSTREESRRPSRRDSENSSTSTSAYRAFFSSQEPLSTLRSPERDDTGRQSFNKEPDDATSPSAPHVPMKIYLPPAEQPRGARGKRRVSVPPPTTLPTIPGTPGSSALSYLTTPVLTNSPPSMGEASLGPDDQKGSTPEVEPQRQSRRDSRVQFRSPLVSAQSAQDTSRTGSEQEAVESAKSSISGVTDVSTNVPWTPFPSPISRDP